jgi:pimeloyl-ACP methyl ester carboxylesterase
MHLRPLGVPLAILVLFAYRALLADGPADNDPAKVRPIPPPGIQISPQDREGLQAGVIALQALIEQLRLKDDSQVRDLLPDVEIFHRAVDQALKHNEFFAPGDVKKAGEVIDVGLARGQALLEGKAPWTTQTGLVVRGFRSRLDDTVQPYGLVIPTTYSFEGRRDLRCDVWLHGRGETSCEVQFIAQRMTQVGSIEPRNTIVLHPFGRYSNAFKFAGEVDVFEALDHARRHYRIDDERTAIRGFSMGGAGCWHLAAHYADRWFAATPGAGFSETPEFLKTFQGETLHPPEWEETLWQWYDCPEWVVNLRHVPTIAYSGELDRQKQAADVMEQAFREESINELALVHIIGPQMAHKIHPDSLAEIESRLSQIASAERTPLPRHVRMQTCTLKYNRMHWLTINGLEQHWKRASLDARLDPFGEITIDHANVDDLTLAFPPGALSDRSRLGSALSPLRLTFRDIREEKGEWPTQTLENDQRLRVMSDGSFRGRFVKADDKWRLWEPADDAGLHKRHNLQGPIDDAFMESFLFVAPTDQARHPQVESWVQSEMQRGVTHWRQQMRGDARVKKDTEVTDEDIANHNLVLWGDPQSNALIAKVLPDLPLEWTDAKLALAGHDVAASGHVPVLIYPNPLNPKKYVVLNSSFTYREYDYLNNARQTAKLPDWAIVDLSEPPGPRWPGKIVAADFFDERWQPRP